MTTNQISAVFRLTAQWKPAAAAAYESAALEVEAGAEKLSDATRAAFRDNRCLPPSSLKSERRILSELREAVYNASTSANLTANQNAVDAALLELGITTATQPA